MHWRSIYVQYPVGTLAFIGILYLLFYGISQKTDARRVLTLCAAVVVLRLGSGVSALVALGHPGAPPYLVQIAIGDVTTAAMAIATVAALIVRSDKALVVATLMNAFGLINVMVSEAWIAFWEHRGLVTRSFFLHLPTIGAAFYSAVHIISFYFIARAHHADVHLDVDVDDQHHHQPT